MKSLIWITIGISLLFGAWVTYHHLSLLPRDADVPWGALFVGLALTAALTSCNLVLRWGRWHFLTRRFGLFFRTRESLRLYFATLPLLAIPAFVGELLRPWTISAADPRGRKVVFKVWFLERFMDALALASWWMVGSNAWGAAISIALVGWLLTAIVAVFFERKLGNPRPKWDGVVFATAALIVSAAAWLLPSLALFATLQFLDSSSSVGAALQAFSSSTLLGGFSGLPLGIGITGAQTLRHVVESGAPSDTATWAVLVLRLGTSFFAVALGAALFVAWRKRLSPLSQTDRPAHFDALAPEYAQEIPEHIVRTLIAKKVSAMLRALDELRPGQGRTGLDLGCGQGWYALEMVRHGFAMSGTDLSSGQVAQARLNAERRGLSLDLVQNEPGKLPFADGAFDFLYTINVVHHVLSDADRKSLFAEITRVLKPDGLFFLHEINTLNPLFRFYMSYVFPLLRRIDEGNERWIHPEALPEISGGKWARVDYFTFLPDFLPESLAKLLRPLERALETSPFARWSAHYVAIGIKDTASSTLSTNE